MDVALIIVLLGIVQGLFIGFVLINKNKAHLKDRLLGLFFIVVAIAIVNFLFRFLHVYKSYPYLNRFLLSELFLIGPVFFFYIKASIDISFGFSVKTLLHFCPFILIFLFNIAFYLLSLWDGLGFIKISYPDYPLKLISFFQYVHIFTYIYFSAVTIRRFNQSVQVSLSDTNNINHKNIAIMISALASIFGLGFLFYLTWIFDIEINDADNIIIPVAVTIVIFITGYLNLRQPDFIHTVGEIQKGKKYGKSALTREKSEEEFNRLCELMENQSLYLDNDLNLIKLAEKLSLSPNHLSQIINENINQNFFDFVNRYRIEEVKKRLLADEYKNYTVIAVAMDSGFNSKSVFNQAFKKFTGTTPTKYRQDSQNI